MINIILLFLMAIFISVYITKKYMCKCEEKVIYKYIPRTLEEEQESEVYVSDIFKAMFEEPSTWILSIDEDKKRKKDKMNKYFISQY